MDKDKVVELTTRLVDILKEGDIWLDDGSADYFTPKKELAEAVDILSQLEEELDDR